MLFFKKIRAAEYPPDGAGDNKKKVLCVKTKLPNDGGKKCLLIIEDTKRMWH